MKTVIDIWSDPELRELVRDEPELVAIADALAQAEPLALRRRGGWVRPGRLLMAAAVLAAAAAVALVAPWNRSSGSLTDLALAAVGSQPVLHVVAELPSNAQLVDIQTGAAQPLSEQQELWYDADQGLKRNVIRAGSIILDDTLETPEGGYTPNGIVYDCTWIAAHPVEATKARVSCNASGDNGTTPHVVPRPKPTLDPGLAGFVDGYQQALAAGQAREDGSGQLNGQTVDWLVFQTSDGSEKVALDQTTHKPVLLEDNSGASTQIDSIETVPYAASDFRRPTPDELPAQPSSGDATDTQTLPLDSPAISNAVPGAVWAGATIEGLPLARAEQQALKTTFADGSLPTQTGTGLELDYGTLDANGHLDRTQPQVQLNEAPTRELAYGNMWGFVHGPTPPAGQLYDGSSSTGFSIGFTVVNGTYVTIRASSHDLLLAAARSLAPPAGP